MNRAEIILLIGIIVALIWMGACVMMEGKQRKYVVMTGAVADIILFLICRNYAMLLIGVAGGILCGVGFGCSPGKYKTAIQEMKGIKNFMIVSIIFFIMIFMTVSIAFPELGVDFRFSWSGISVPPALAAHG